MTTRIISSILQIIAVPVWALLALIAFFMENYWIGVTATISSILIIISVFVTLIVDSSKQRQRPQIKMYLFRLLDVLNLKSEMHLSYRGISLFYISIR